jgi:hypothetical protein
MGNLVLDNKLLSTISSLAERMKTTREDVVKMTVDSFMKKVSEKNRLMQFAGILEDDEADDMLKTIYENR